MARLEIPVRTHLRFRKRVVLVLDPAPTPETVSITCDGREFGWLAIGPTPMGTPTAPTATTIVTPDSPEEWRESVGDVQRFLSALAFHYDTHVDSGSQTTGTGEPDLLHSRGFYRPHDHVSFRMELAPVQIDIDKSSRLRVALAVYREGLNVTSPFLSFLAFWNALDASFDGDEGARDAFLAAEAAISGTDPRTSRSQSIATYLREHTRNPVAHTIRRDSTMTHIDPDLPGDRVRLERDSELVRRFARKAILARWPNALTVQMPEP